MPILSENGQIGKKKSEDLANLKKKKKLYMNLKTLYEDIFKKKI